jgi:predicted nucleotidyltransferase
LKFAPSQEEIIDILKAHKLIKLKERVLQSFLVGSFAKEALGVGETHEESDVDILLEVKVRPGVTALELEDGYRNALRSYFMKHNIRGKNDAVHPQWQGRRVDLYFTYDASKETRPKIALQLKREISKPIEATEEIADDDQEISLNRPRLG